MGAGLLSGFERGFNMMERHQARVGRDDRSARLDQQNESRYQDGKMRLADMDSRNEDRYQQNQTQQTKQQQDQVDYRNKVADNTANYREQTVNATKEHRQWQKNQADEQKKWGLAAPQMENYHNEYFKTGRLPEQAANFFEENPEYNDYNPASYRSPEYRNSVKMLRDKTTEIFKGKKLHKFKDPEYIKLFDQAFQSKIKQGVGEMDLPRNAKIIDKKVSQLIPTRDGKVSIGLEVTYQDADGKTYTEIQPMTKGKTSDPEDPVNEWELKEVLSAIETRASMADMAENGESYLNRSKNTLGAMGFGSPSKGDAKSKAAYRKEVNAINKEMRKAKSEANAGGYGDDEKKAYLKPYRDALTEIDQAYGVAEKAEPDPDNNDPFGLFDDQPAPSPSKGKVQANAEPKKVVTNKSNEKAQKQEPTPNYDDWASPPQSVMDVTGLNAIGRGIGGIVDWNSKKNAQARYASAYGEVPTDEQLKVFLAQEQKSLQQRTNK